MVPGRAEPLFGEGDQIDVVLSLSGKFPIGGEEGKPGAARASTGGAVQAVQE
ncbi:hypothetical protein GCM10010320_03830 [Streptomyces caelestis]|nr:hypothetical protein GCM10010320_03830 [Streptomyces caelestis]